MKDAVLESKKAVVSEIQEKMTASQSTVVVEYRGLTVAEVTELTRQEHCSDRKPLCEA